MEGLDLIFQVVQVKRVLVELMEIDQAHLALNHLYLVQILFTVAVAVVLEVLVTKLPLEALEVKAVVVTEAHRVAITPLLELMV
jgi:hypothetical protein